MDIETVVVEIRREPGTEDIPLPEYMSEHASGMDLRAAVDAPVELAPGQIRLIPTGVTLAVPPGFEAQVRPRSGLAARHAIGVLNSPGTIDSDYRGEVHVLLYNFGEERFRVARGDRIAQMVFVRVHHPELVTRELTHTERAAGGFGHTGGQ